MGDSKKPNHLQDRCDDRTCHSHSQDDPSTSGRPIHLDEPRPTAVRSENEYVDVTSLPMDVAQFRRHYRSYDPNRNGHVIEQTAGDARKPGRRRSDLERNGVHHETKSHRIPGSVEGSGSSFRPIGSGHSIMPDRSTTFDCSNTCDRPTTSDHPTTSDRPIMYDRPTSDRPIISERLIMLDRSIAADRALVPPGQVIRVVSTSCTTSARIPLTHFAIENQPRSVVRYGLSYGTAKPSDYERLPSSMSFVQSIICKDCGRCRCNACSKPKQLPSRWICGNHCLLSSHSIVDILSCMCCVKAFLYHTSGRVYDTCPVEDQCDDRGPFLDSSTSQLHRTDSLWACGNGDCCFRWTSLICAFAFLPCLWLYLPLRSCAQGVEAAYEGYYDNGCRCERGGIEPGETAPINSRYFTLSPALAAKEATSSLQLPTAPKLPGGSAFKR